MPAVGNAGRGLADVSVHLIAGDKDRAIGALRRVLAAGWRVNGWMLRVDLVFKPLRSCLSFSR